MRAYKTVSIHQPVSLQSSCEFNGNMNEKWLIIRPLDILALFLLISKNQPDNLEGSLEKHVFLLFKILGRVSAGWHCKLQLLVGSGYQKGLKKGPSEMKGRGPLWEKWIFPLLPPPRIQSCNPYMICYWCDLYTFYSGCETRYENGFLWRSILTCVWRQAVAWC